MSYSPQFASSPVHEVVQVSAANTARDGTGTIVDLVTGGPGNGTVIEAVSARATATTTAGQLRLFYKEAAADTYRLIAELAVSAATPSATVQTFGGGFTLPASQIYLPTGAMLGVSTHNAETFNVTGQGFRL